MLFTQHYRLCFRCAKYRGKHFQGILNVSKNISCWEHIVNICSNIPPSEDTVVTIDEMCEAINSSKSGKSPDHHGKNSEHFKFGSNHIQIMLSFLVTSMLVHGYIPMNLLLSSLVPLAKNISQVTLHQKTTMDLLL